MSDSDLLFGAEDHSDANDAEITSTNDTDLPKWRVLIVDDEEQVHKVTSLVLGRCEFEHAKVELVHAMSMEEAMQILSTQEPFALALVDVVMETDDAGIRLVQYIRQELKDHAIRLVLRTGQPGQAPESTVISKYDINDYKNKTELTSIKLKTLLYSTLRNYRDIQTIDKNRQDLYNLINATSKVVDSQELHVFASAALEEINNLINLDGHAVCAHTPVDAVAATAKEQEYSILAATGHIKESLSQGLPLSNEVIEYFERAKISHKTIYENNIYIGYYNSSAAGENLLYVKSNGTLNKMSRHLLDIFTRCVAVTHHNIKSKELVKHSRQELVYVLSETIEKRTSEKNNHVRRVSAMSHLLAKKMKLSGTQCEHIKLAALLHDIGTIGIPDKTLSKTEVFTQQDKETMIPHTIIGGNILRKSKRPMLQMASVIAEQHHEWWDGSGQPKQLKENQIDIAARIVGISDTLDSIFTQKSYRGAFSEDNVRQHLMDMSAKQFDPDITNAALEILPQLQEIREQFPDNLLPEQS